MKNSRCYYSSTILDFCSADPNSVLGTIHSNNSFSETRLQQSNTWLDEINILQGQLYSLNEGRIIFEYIIPRMGKRVDVVLLFKNIVFLLEFKCGDTEYQQSTVDQVLDYALDLKNFQKESHDKLIIPIVVSTEAASRDINLNIKDNVAEPIFCNKSNIVKAIQFVAHRYNEPSFDYIEWENSQYLPTPTIIEAARAMYLGHNVKDITRNDAGAQNLGVTTDAVNEIINKSKTLHRKSICFVTGVPGAGKTLVGLNLAIQHSDKNKGEHAVFLSGNLPLVKVLQEALARDKVIQSKELGIKLSKSEALRETNSFIQIIHKYRDSFVGNNECPPEKITIFDEAQRAWTQQQIAEFMKTKKRVVGFRYSEPEFLIETMDRHKDWAVIVCLIGGGQEINSGEAGLPEWFNSLQRSFPHWDIYVTPQLNDAEYCRDYSWSDLMGLLNVSENKNLHLSTSIRSFRTPNLASFVKAVLDHNTATAKRLYCQFKDKYPIFLTRNLDEAKRWVKEKSRGTTRYGLLASSGATRLKPEGIFVKNNIDIPNWFLNDKTDVRSSYYLEDVVSEFDIQGLELDYTIVAWDADFRITNSQWSYNNFVGNKWCNVNTEDNKMYLKNAYRVLLTRARQGMAIFIPEGNDLDWTRPRSFYDGTYNYLKEILENIPEQETTPQSTGSPQQPSPPIRFPKLTTGGNVIIYKLCPKCKNAYIAQDQTCCISCVQTHGHDESTRDKGNQVITSNCDKNFFFVFQGSNYQRELNGEYIFAPKNGPHHWERLLEIKVGDVIFHADHGEIKAISVATSTAHDYTREGVRGRKVNCDYIQLPRRIHTDNFIADILRNNEKYSPFNKLGKGNQGYLFSLNKTLANVFLNGIFKANKLSEQSIKNRLNLL